MRQTRFFRHLFARTPLSFMRLLLLSTAHAFTAHPGHRVAVDCVASATLMGTPGEIMGRRDGKPQYDTRLGCRYGEEESHDDSGRYTVFVGG